MTTQEIDELFAAILLGDYDDDEPWSAVKTLRSSGNQYIFDKATDWAGSDDPKRRARAADILGQLRCPRTPEMPNNEFPGPIFVDESFETIARMAARETDEEALSSELFGLGHLYKPEAVPISCSTPRIPTKISASPLPARSDTFLRTLPLSSI